MYRLMVVDDSTIIRNKISRTSTGNQQNRFKIVCTATNGHEAIEQCKKHLPDIATMDITMPGMDGLETIPKLLEIKPDLQILVVSALSDESTGLKALELGASGFVIKPFTEIELQRALESIIDFIEEGNNED